MPFRVPWTDGAESATFVDDVLAFHLGARERWRRESWSLLLCVFRDGEPIGAQDVRGEDFAAARRFETGSWLGPGFPGSGARHGDAPRGSPPRLRRPGRRDGGLGRIRGQRRLEASLERLGYETVGEVFSEPRGEPVRELVFELSRERWAAREHPPVEIAGLEACLPLFGL